MTGQFEDAIADRRRIGHDSPPTVDVKPGIFDVVPSRPTYVRSSHMTECSNRIGRSPATYAGPGYQARVVDHSKCALHQRDGRRVCRTGSPARRQGGPARSQD